MPEVIVVCVSDDLPQAEGLAEMFENSGFSVRDDVFSDAAVANAVAGILVLTRAAAASGRFRDAADRLIEAGKAIVVRLEDVRRLPMGNAPVFDLAGWYGEVDDPALDPIFFAVDRMRADRLRGRSVTPRSVARAEAPALEAQF